MDVARVKIMVVVAVNLMLGIGGAGVAWHHASASLADRAKNLQIGDQVSAVDGVTYADHERTLLIAVRNGCAFAERSMPFYQELFRKLSASHKDVEARVIAPDVGPTIAQLLQIHGVAAPFTAETQLGLLKIHLTPTVVLVDRSGRVVDIWRGELPKSVQLEVLRAVGAD